MYMKKNRFFDLALVLALLLPGAVFCAHAAGEKKAAMSDERINAILAKADDVLEREADIEAAAQKFNDPKFLHRVTNRREVWLESVRNFNQKTVLPLEQFGPVSQFDGFYGWHYAKLGVQVKDLMQPFLYGAELLFDIDSMGEYFDSVVEMVAEAIIKKEDVVFYNLDLMLNTENESLFATMFKNLDEALQKSMASNDQMRRLAIKFFKKRVVPSMMKHVKKVAKSPPFIFRTMPKTEEEKEEAFAAIHQDYPETDEERAAWAKTAPVVSVLDYAPVRLIAEPIISVGMQPLEMKLNEAITGYADERPSLRMLEMSSRAINSAFRALFPRGAGGITELVLELGKQANFIKPIDEALSFTLGIELIFNLGFFYHTLNSAIEKGVQDLVVNDCVALHDAIRIFEMRIASPRNQAAEKQAEVRQEFKNAIYAIVIRNLGPMQPILLEKMRAHHRNFQTCINVALISPMLYKIARVIYPIARIAMSK